jgi:aspartyl-tRNA(Asn)/glutamyl-tRNA(Gln) amidotransferase subunit A
LITSLSVIDLSKKLHERELSAVDVAKAYLDDIHAKDQQYGCYLTVDNDAVVNSAKEAQKLLDSGKGTPLTGVPISVKDNICTKDLRTTCASKMLENYVPTYNATVIEKLNQSGLVVLGKANLDEFAMGTSNENSAFQVTRNPWDLTRSPGGSSGGPAAAVAANLAPLALGSDTGGSIRLPAALCGIVGFKPTYGRCSRYGLVAYGSSLDQIGPFARSVEELALLSEVITGHDPNDSTSLPEGPISARNLKNGSLKGVKIALPKELFGDKVHSGVREVVQNAIEQLEKAGAVLTEISLPTIEQSVSVYYIIAPAEASSNLARYDGVRFGPKLEGDFSHIDLVAKVRASGFGHEVKQRIMIGTYVLSAGYYDAYYLKAQQLRSKLTHEFDSALKDFDVILSPTSPMPAFKLGELNKDPLELKLLDYCTIPANLGGFPAISLNAGYTEGLPVGMQLLTRCNQDEKLLQLAYCVEQEIGKIVPQRKAASLA